MSDESPKPSKETRYFYNWLSLAGLVILVGSLFSFDGFGDSSLMARVGQRADYFLNPRMWATSALISSSLSLSL